MIAKDMASRLIPPKQLILCRSLRLSCCPHLPSLGPLAPQCPRPPHSTCVTSFKITDLLSMATLKDHIIHVIIHISSGYLFIFRSARIDDVIDWFYLEYYLVC